MSLSYSGCRFGWPSVFPFFFSSVSLFTWQVMDQKENGWEENCFSFTLDSSRREEIFDDLLLVIPPLDFLLLSVSFVFPASLPSSSLSLVLTTFLALLFPPMSLDEETHSTESFDQTNGVALPWNFSLSLKLLFSIYTVILVNFLSDWDWWRGGKRLWKRDRETHEKQMNERKASKLQEGHRQAVCEWHGRGLLKWLRGQRQKKEERERGPECVCLTGSIHDTRFDTQDRNELGSVLFLFSLLPLRHFSLPLFSSNILKREQKEVWYEKCMKREQEETCLVINNTI